MDNLNKEQIEKKELKKKKRKSLFGKILAFLVIIAISIAFSKYNFVDIGHDFIMSIFNVISGQSVDEPVNTMSPEMSENNMETENSETENPETDSPEAGSPETENFEIENEME